MLMPAIASAQNVVSVGNTDYTLTETGTRNGGPRTIDITTTGGNITLDVGTIGVVNNGVTTGAGISANNTGTGNVSIRDAAITATGTGVVNGIDARTATGNVTIVSTGTINANNNVASRGIQAISGGGNITITADTTNGGRSGIFTGTNNGIFPNVVTIVSNVATASGVTSPNAIIGQGQTVNITSTSASNTNVAGVSGTAIFANAGTGGAIVRSGTAEALGNGQAAIQIYSDAAVLLESTTARTTQSSDGLSVQSGTNVTIRSGTVTTAGAGGRGIVVNTLAAPVNITSTAITTTGANAAGMLITPGTGATTITSGTISATGAGSDGIFVSGTGPITITTTGTTTAGRTGISAQSLGSVINVNTAAVTATGTASAINAVSNIGPASVTINGAVTAPGATNAIVVTGGTNAALTLSANGSLTAAGRGALLTSVNGSTVNNAGTITGNATTAILTATGGALTFNNSGSFTGLIGFTAGNDVVNNSGTYNVQNNQAFGAGTDVFNNSGTLAVLRGTTVAGTVALTELETLNNSGLVDLRNGHTGDVFSTSSTFAGSGNSVLGIDVALANASTGSSSDRLTATGAITGTTTLAITRLDSNAGILNAGTVFATGGAGSSANAFVLAPGTATQGFARYALVFNAAANSYSLVGGPSNAVFRTLKVTEGAQQLWHKSADAVAAHMSASRNVLPQEASGARIWGTMFGLVNTRKTSQQAAAFGQTRTVDLSYKQDAFGGQAGVDFGPGGTFAFGVTGGYLSSMLSFDNSANRVKYSVANAGVYASFSSGGIFANALAKYDRAWVRARDVTAGYTNRDTADTYGARGELGFHLGMGGFYAEPVASIAYVRTDMDDFRALNAVVDFDRLEGLRGKAGLRLGTDMMIGGGNKLQAYAQGNYVHEFEGGDGVAFTSGGTTLRYANRPIGDFGEAKIGFSVASVAGVTGFVEGFGDFSKQYKGGGGRAGIRFGF